MRTGRSALASTPISAANSLQAEGPTYRDNPHPPLSGPYIHPSAIYWGASTPYQTSRPSALHRHVGEGEHIGAPLWKGTLPACHTWALDAC